LIGLHGILTGLGEIIGKFTRRSIVKIERKSVYLGGGLFGFITKPRTSSQRALIVLIGFILQIIYYYFVLINIPLDASANESNSKPYIDFR